jgi:hypothetical protein
MVQKSKAAPQGGRLDEIVEGQSANYNCVARPDEILHMLLRHNS